MMVDFGTTVRAVGSLEKSIEIKCKVIVAGLVRPGCSTVSTEAVEGTVCNAGHHSKHN
jgi:hypothetical protein